MTKAELIATLVTDKFSGFKDGDEPILEAASDARLEEFRVASVARKVSADAFTKLEADNRNQAARLKVAEDKLRTAESELSEEDFLNRAPTSIKTLIEEHKTVEAQTRASLVSQLKDRGVDTEEVLKTKSTEELKTLARYARVEIQDFSGRGLPRERENTRTGDYRPPSVYAAGIKKLQEAGGKR